MPTPLTLFSPNASALMPVSRQWDPPSAAGYPTPVKAGDIFDRVWFGLETESRSEDLVARLWEVYRALVAEPMPTIGKRDKFCIIAEYIDRNNPFHGMNDTEIGRVLKMQGFKSVSKSGRDPFLNFAKGKQLRLFIHHARANQRHETVPNLRWA